MKLLMSLLEAVLLLTGAGSAEELAESEFERFEALSAHPVCINLASAGRLRSCGLFSEYQVASLQDYRERTGDILSLTELGTVPGFTPELVCALAWFISLESYNPAGTREKTRIRQEAMGRMTVKKGSGSLRDASVAYAGKYHLEAGERADLYLSWKTGPTASVTVYGRRPWKLIAGDYNVRLGQGLLVWDGFLLSGYPSVASFRRNASGFSGTGSFTPGRRGLATAYDGRRWWRGLVCQRCRIGCRRRCRIGIVAWQERERGGECPLRAGWQRNLAGLEEGFRASCHVRRDWVCFFFRKGFRAGWKYLGTGVQTGVLHAWALQAFGR